ncbi:hypothetical protein [Sulfitobacter sabulilitoris]|uniref:Uncharacterized protein n=1 Tax=Sulfitobacter sabulilitoris TaxID=2562655 RepID=A0A5S3Q7C6_9RHOB|nr:hypothetical protein [Sulfitobacter sabulilitoris]TMM52753.1 hypothetical protein FDT80_10865 [Sulfitobacter sabulilitoris]
MRPIAFAIGLCILPVTAFAEPPVIENVAATRSGGTWRFDVTIRHPDSGWDHYADGWRVLDMNGKELAMRPLAHPHTDEQPFTRSLSGVTVPADAAQVQVQARDYPNGWNSDTTVVTLK